MDKSEFLTALRETGANWQVREHGGVLRCERGDCPIIAVARKRGLRDAAGFAYMNSEWREAGKALGLSEDDAAQIVSAADSAAHSLRTDLLEACHVR